MKKLFLLFLFVGFSLSIFGQETIPLKDALSLIECKVSEYASSIEYIPLEDREECLLSNELNVVVTAQDIFVRDAKENKVFQAQCLWIDNCQKTLSTTSSSLVAIPVTPRPPRFCWR